MMFPILFIGLVGVAVMLGWPLGRVISRIAEPRFGKDIQAGEGNAAAASTAAAQAKGGALLNEA
jgi:hypothetical protein